MANTPLKSSCVDVVVMCLALMGTTLAAFIREARRIMVKDGVLKIAEVRSRLEANDKVQTLCLKCSIVCIPCVTISSMSDFRKKRS